MKNKRALDLKWSLNLGHIAGIRMSIHWTFFILIGWIFLSYQKLHGTEEALMGVVFILSLFICVTLHELGHALTAKRFGITTKSITLLPIGGLAQMEKLPEKPTQELLVALAGPLVNVVIAVLLYIYLLTANTIPDISELENLSLIGSGFWFNLFVANLVLAIFNLIPAFPMDGGRVLRALLAMKYDRNRATAMAAGVGQLLAIAFVFFGFYANIWLVFIGVFIYLGAGAEASFENTKSMLSGHTISDVIMHQFTALSPDDTLESSVKLLLDGAEHEFVVIQGQQVVGVLTKKDMISGLTEHGKTSSVGQSMRSDFLTFSSDIPLQEAYEKFTQNTCPIAPVIDQGQITGIVSKENLNEFILVEQVMHPKN